MNINNLINSYNHFAPEYEARLLSNHLPMAVFALFKLGANKSEIQNFIKKYLEKHNLIQLETTSDIHPISPIDEKNLGTRRNFLGLKQYFHNCLAQKGVEYLLKNYFPKLLPGISAGAFHALIRLAYGVDSENNDEILSGISYLADAYLVLKSSLPEISNRKSNIKDQLHYICQAHSSKLVRIPKLEGVIFKKMDIASEAEFLTLDTDMIKLSKESQLEDLADIAINLYATTKNFTALHTVTGCHALRILFPYVSDKTLALRYFYQAFIAAYLTINAPEICFEHAVNNDLNILEIKKLARLDYNDHNIKLTYSALEEYEHYKNPLYLTVLNDLFEDK